MHVCHVEDSFTQNRACSPVNVPEIPVLVQSPLHSSGPPTDFT